LHIAEAIEVIVAIMLIATTTAVVVLLFGIQTALFFVIQAHPVFVIRAPLLWVIQAPLLWVIQGIKAKLILVSRQVTQEIMGIQIQMMDTQGVLSISDNEIQWFVSWIAILV
jgi:hypothetical protein